MSKKICFIMNSMGAGGAERVVSLLSNSLSARDYKVSILVSGSDQSFYKIDEKVDYVKLNLDSKTNSVFKKIKVNFTEIKEYVNYLKATETELVITFIRNVPTIIACKIAGVKVIVSERNNPEYDPPNPVWRVLRKFIYPIADGFVFQTEQVKRYFYESIQKKSVVIANPLQENLPLHSVKKRKKQIVSVGRLAEQKNHESLIKAYAIVRDIFPDYELIIYGEGELRPRLEKIISDYGIKEFVSLPGQKINIHKEILEASLFVFPSIYEGYPNALAEAMALGLPVISTNCNYGPTELIENGHNGYLVPVDNTEKLAEAMIHLLTDEKTRNKIGNNATKIRKKLNVNLIIDEWIEYIDSF